MNFSCNCWVPKPSHTELKGNTGRTVMFSSVGTTVGLFTTESQSLLCGSNAKRWEPRLAPGAVCWSKGCLLSQQFSCQPPLTTKKKNHRLKYFGNGPGLFRQLIFFSVMDFFWFPCSVRVFSILQHIEAGSYHFNGVGTFWSSNISFSMVLAKFWCSLFSCWVVFCD